MEHAMTQQTAEMIPNKRFNVRLSSLELVQKRRRRGKLATLRAYAKANFDPWQRDRDMNSKELLPSNQTLLNCGVPARIAYAMMLKSKEELIEMFDKLELEDIDSMMASIVESAETLKAIASMLEMADTRMLVAACARELGKRKPKRKIKNSS
jgi:hypothetical protein